MRFPRHDLLAPADDPSGVGSGTSATRAATSSFVAQKLDPAAVAFLRERADLGGATMARALWGAAAGHTWTPDDLPPAPEPGLAPGDWDRLNAPQDPIGSEGVLSGKFVPAFYSRGQLAFVDQLVRGWLVDLMADLATHGGERLCDRLADLPPNDLADVIAGSPEFGLPPVSDEHLKPLLDLRTELLSAVARGRDPGDAVPDARIRKALLSIPLTAAARTVVSDAFATVVLLSRDGAGRWDVAYAFGSESQFRPRATQEGFSQLAARVTPLAHGKTNLLDDPISIGIPKIEKGNGEPFDLVIQLAHDNNKIPNLLLAADIPSAEAEDVILPVLQHDNNPTKAAFEASSRRLAAIIAELVAANRSW